jgi:hypothetical protein
VAICVEDLLTGDRDSFADLSVTFSSTEGESIREVLDRFQLLYPQIAWSARDGIIILRATPLTKMSDDPLETKATPVAINVLSPCAKHQDWDTHMQGSTEENRWQG